MIRVLVVEDHPLYHLRVATLVTAMVGFTVVGEYGDAESALDTPADLVVLDLGLPGDRRRGGDPDGSGRRTLHRPCSCSP